MSIRELTQDEEARLLSQEEVDVLPEGMPAMIKWSGGNGPWRYRVGKWKGHTVALSERGFVVSVIEFVGKERYHTRVFLSL